MKSTLARFRKPLEFFVPKLRDNYDEQKEAKRLEVAFKTIFNSTDGEIVLAHLITEYGLDVQIGNTDDVRYISAQQDVIKYILSMAN